jgi:Crinkler effector protein N-terminal domain
VTLRSPGTTIDLFAHILGDSPASEHTFSVTVKASDFVDTLRKEVYIAKQNRFKGIDASDLVLWKVLPLCSFRHILC